MKATLRAKLNIPPSKGPCNRFCSKTPTIACYFEASSFPSPSRSAGVPGTLTPASDPCQKNIPSPAVVPTMMNLNSHPTILPYEKIQLASHFTTGVTSSSFSLSSSGFIVQISPISARKTRPRKTQVKTSIQARRMDMSFVVCRTWKPAATRGVTCSKALLISLE